MKENKDLIKYEGNIFKKIFNFIKGLFSKEKVNIEPINVEPIPKVEIKNSIDQYKVETDSSAITQELRMNNIFQDYLDGSLNVDEISLQEAFMLQKKVNDILSN